MAEVKFAGWRIDVYASDATVADPDFDLECDEIEEQLEAIVKAKLKRWPGARYEVY